jgi:hypothetical protein
VVTYVLLCWATADPVPSLPSNPSVLIGNTPTPDSGAECFEEENTRNRVIASAMFAGYVVAGVFEVNFWIAQTTLRGCSEE